MSDLSKRLAELSPETRLLLGQALQEQTGAFNTFPLSFAQQRFWFLEQWAPGDPVYHLPGILDLEGRLDVAVLWHSLRAIVRRHEALRTTFVTIGDEPLQLIHPGMDLPLPLLDLQALPEPTQEAQMRGLARAEARR